jgi:hypothetical protein
MTQLTSDTENTPLTYKDLEIGALFTVPGAPDVLVKTDMDAGNGNTYSVFAGSSTRLGEHIVYSDEYPVEVKLRVQEERVTKREQAILQLGLTKEKSLITDIAIKRLEDILLDSNSSVDMQLQTINLLREMGHLNRYDIERYEGKEA